MAGKLPVQSKPKTIKQSYYLHMRMSREDFKELIHFHHMTCMVTSQHKNPCPGSQEIYNSG